MARQQLGAAASRTTDQLTLAEAQAKFADGASAPRFLTYSSGWPSRPNDNRLTIFVGGSATSNAPADPNLRASDLWFPAS